MLSTYGSKDHSQSHLMTLIEPIPVPIHTKEWLWQGLEGLGGQFGRLLGMNQFEE